MIRALLLICITAFAATAQAQTPKDAEPAQTDFLEDAKKYVMEFPRDRAKLTLNEKSLMNWTNPIRQQERGAIYVWTHEGRPLAIGSLFTYGYDGKIYTKHELHSLAPGPLRASYNGTLGWTPKEPGVEWTDFKGENAQQPGSTRTARLLQMRQLARNFRAELYDPKEQRTELRLAPRPLYDYSAPKAGVLDGVLLSFVVATDPEVLMLLEAYDEDRGGQRATGFRYGFARFHYWHVAAFDGDRKVWEATLDKSHEQNQLGDRENISKIYNSFHPTPRK